MKYYSIVKYCALSHVCKSAIYCKRCRSALSTFMHLISSNQHEGISYPSHSLCSITHHHSLSMCSNCLIYGFFFKFFALHFMFSFNPLICAIDVLIFFSNLVSLYPTFHIYYIIEFAQVMSLRHTWNCYLLFIYLMYTPLLLKHH